MKRHEFLWITVSKRCKLSAQVFQQCWKYSREKPVTARDIIFSQLTAGAGSTIDRLCAKLNKELACNWQTHPYIG